MARLITTKAVLSTASDTSTDLLKISEYRVPKYQRDYSWGPDELSKLWDDVLRTRARAFIGGQLGPDPEPHFMGAIVTQGDGAGAAEVIDGQQRLTTLSILISVLYEFADRIADPSVRTNVTMQLLPLIANTHASGRMPRLVLAREQDFYAKSVVENLTMSERTLYWSTVTLTRRPTRLRIKAAIEILQDCLERELGSAPNRDARLIEIVDVVTELLLFLRLNVGDHRMAYRVFETLNFRGLDLSQADLIKNELVRRGGEQGTQQQVVGDWEKVVGNLEKITQISLVEFLQFHYASKYAAVRASDLFESVTELLDEGAGLAARDYTLDLVEESARLVQLIDGDSGVWSVAANQALEEIRDTLGLKMAYPLLMSAAARYSSAPVEFDAWALRVRDFCFRYFTIGRNPLGSFTSVVTRAARQLRDDSTSPTQVLHHLRMASPDQVFIDAFAKCSVSTNKLGFYVIRRIEDHISSGSGKTFPQGPTQHLEHIMPKRPGTMWKSLAKDPRYDLYLMRIGNLLGLEQKINSYIKNKELPFKLSNSRSLDYTHSKFALPSGVVKYLNGSGGWDFDSIEKRQSDLATKYAVAVWPLS